MPTTPEFEDAYKKLNAEQREAVDAIDGPVFVIAGPGTGKTQVLTLRIAQDSSEDRLHAGIYSCFNVHRKGAAREMRERLTRLIGSTASRECASTLFHGFCAVAHYSIPRPLSENRRRADCDGCRAG